MPANLSDCRCDPWGSGAGCPRCRYPIHYDNFRCYLHVFFALSSVSRKTISGIAIRPNFRATLVLICFLVRLPCAFNCLRRQRVGVSLSVVSCLHSNCCHEVVNGCWVTRSRWQPCWLVATRAVFQTPGADAAAGVCSESTCYCPYPGTRTPTSLCFHLWLSFCSMWNTQQSSFVTTAETCDRNVYSR